MKNRYKSIIVTLSVMLILSACDNFLDVKPVSSITSSSFWNKPEDCEAYLTGIYNSVRSRLNTELYGEDRGDSFEPGHIGPVSEAWAQSLNASNSPSWQSFYNTIYHLNRLFSETEGIEFTNSNDKNRILAEAYALRALIYYQMAKIWGDIPLVTTPTENADVELVARSGVNEVFNFINQDIDQALSLFPEEGYVDKNRMSKPATYALQADVKMWTGKVLGGGEGDFNSALSAIEKVEASGVSLLNDFRSIFDSSNKKNNEIIFSIFFEYQEANEHYAKRISSWGINVTSAVNYSDLPVTERNNARHVYGPSSELKNAFAEYNTDVRKNVSMIDAVLSNGDIILSSQNKFRGTVYDDRYFDDDLIVYRLADIISLKAEALAALNRLPEAITELNRIKQRAQIPAYSGPEEKVAVEKEILKERWKELFLELKRYPDLVRFHFGGTINIYEKVPNLNGKEGYPLYFPVEQSVMDNNALITQTEGYE
ncbi:RagB/SusD family nutrient uptake outer membrane protein [Maribellus maritimus]|uniref:RagB/SusD family nutrient uptake outer membrane protein n=1 Tax=Maribellus maritimus TaxID=2870838 RepID=UPI001EEC5064|nr:RagB/SusD family nutrient uptake outer membrane protein [Maribellus maritimus]MCG6190642.1 RagB/SusD family nutrient uptake outer membrane protein [Maribellus maritimus]